MSFDELRCDPAQFGGREGDEEVPGEVEGLFDRASPLTLADEAVFEVIDKGQDAAVVVGQRLFAHDRDEATQFLPATQEGRELVGKPAMVLAGALGPDPAVHEAAQRGQHVDRW
jgi:hypothetical protein